MVFGFFGFCAGLQLLGIFLVRMVPASHQVGWILSSVILCARSVNWHDFGLTMFSYSCLCQDTRPPEANMVDVVRCLACWSGSLFWLIDTALQEPNDSRWEVGTTQHNHKSCIRIRDVFARVVSKSHFWFLFKGPLSEAPLPLHVPQWIRPACSTTREVWRRS